jgi:hypothetical protein
MEGTAELAQTHRLSGNGVRQLLVRAAAAAIDDRLSAGGGDVELNLDPGCWDAVVRDAEASHLTPLLASYLREHPAVPLATRRQLDVLMLRHRGWHRERMAALTEILEAFDRASIDVIVLKGAALAWTIYPSPALRSMSDLDLLVPRGAASAAQATLESVGFRAPAAARRFGRNAHHLPAVSRLQGGFTITVEVHVDALSRDISSSIAMEALTGAARPFSVNGRGALALGHVDMLRHLAHHLLEPAFDGVIRLVGVVDLLRYARIFHDEIDWQRLERAHTFVPNVLRCLHDVVPLPAALRRFAPPSAAPRPARAGEMMRPLRSILAPGRSIATVIHELFGPPEWWMHAYYNVPYEASLARVRVFRHPARVARWFALRVAGF